jgi:hypothetical protein
VLPHLANAAAPAAEYAVDCHNTFKRLLKLLLAHRLLMPLQVQQPQPRAAPAAPTSQAAPTPQPSQAS